MRKLAVPASRAAALVKEVIAPACVEVVWQVSLDNNNDSMNNRNNNNDSNYCDNKPDNS